MTRAGRAGVPLFASGEGGTDADSDGLSGCRGPQARAADPNRHLLRNATVNPSRDRNNELHQAARLESSHA